MKNLVLTIALIGFLGIGNANAQNVFLTNVNETFISVESDKNPKEKNKMKRNLELMKKFKQFDKFKIKKVAEIAREMDKMIQASERKLKKPVMHSSRS